MNFYLSVIASIVAGIIVLLLSIWIVKEGRIKNPVMGFVIRIALLKTGLGIHQAYSFAYHVYKELGDNFKNSEKCQVLHVRGHDLITVGRKAILKQHIHQRSSSGFETKILFLNPESPYVEERARRISVNPETLREGIMASILEIQSLVSQGINVEWKLYDIRPTFALYIFDNCLFVSFFVNDLNRRDSPAMRIKTNSILYKAFTNYFDWLWNISEKKLFDKRAF